MHSRTFRAATLGLALMLASAGAGLAQSADDPPTPSDDAPALVVVGQQSDASQPLFVRILDPLDTDLDVPLATSQLTIRGIASPGAVVSLDGQLEDTDDMGNFADNLSLDEGANVISVVASDGDGNQVDTTVYVVRGD
jgi:hypothetical protein